MWRFLVLILLYPFLLRSDHLFPGDENPAIFHHVNVITGHLNLQVTDTFVRGAVPISMTRCYSSSAALDRYFNDSADVLFFRGYGQVHGGWNLLPLAILRIDSSENGKECSVYVTDPSGNRTHYIFSHSDPGNKHVIFLKNLDPFYQTSGHLSGRNNPENSYMRIDLKNGEAILSLPNGGVRTYRGMPLRKTKGGMNHYLLYEEILPSKHKLKYKYNSFTLCLEKISSTNPSETKTFSWIEFKTPALKKFIDAKTSDNKAMQYKYKNAQGKEYLYSVENPHGKNETSEFVSGRTSTGCRMESVAWGGKNQFRVHYHLPPPEKEGIWAHFPDQVDFITDKVRFLEAPIGPDDKMLPIATFSYFPDHTDVRDVDHLLIRYEHDSTRLKQIRYFDKNDQPHSSQKFFWNGSRLCCKAMLDCENKPIFAKTFAFDSKGNVEKEVFWGNLTGETDDLIINEKGEPSRAETYTKKYTYASDANLLAVEEQEDGPIYRYFYKTSSDLLEKKLTCDGSKILIREFYEYDLDNILITEIVDDGSTENLNDPPTFTQRIIKRYERDPASGLAKDLTELYWDRNANQEKQIKKTTYTYNSQNLVETESVYDAKGICRYTLTTKYDPHGNIKSKTTPLGYENTYAYDEYDQLTEIKEVGSPKKIFTYDAAGRQKTCEEPVHDRLTSREYDAKGRILSTTEFNNHTIEQTFDALGRCKETKFPIVKNENGESYKPVIEFDYDVQGNLTSITTPRGEITKTVYNALRKPVHVVQADEKEVSHIYNKNGTLSKTIYADKTEVSFSYDLFQRKTLEEKRTPSGEILSKETWTYNVFHLSTYIDPNGLVTTFTYDGAGRKISEKGGGREILFAYDDLGFLEKTTQGSNSKIEKHNCAGLIEETWQEDVLGCEENYTKFFYDNELRKEKAIRKTSKGDAIDLFSYFDEGKLKTHTDPDGNITRFDYNYSFKNDLSQNVLQKTTADPSGNATLETYDANHRPVLCEKKSPEGATMFKEESFYDRSGNRAKRESTVFSENKPAKKAVTTWEYDQMGRIKKQTEGGKKTTLYAYDDRGRLYQKTLPSGLVLTSVYDGADRLTHFSSSDGAINYEYSSFKGSNPKRIIDHAQNTIIERRYNDFGEMVQEDHHASGRSLEWSYDSLGRCKTFTLPDGSSIAYDYAGLHLSSVIRYSPDEKPRYQHSYLSFDPNGHVAEEETIFRLRTIQTERDLFERPSSQTSPWLSHSISYNELGLVSEIKNSLFGNKLCTYDPLGQLNQEGQKEYRFDSLGNPLDFEMDECSQIIGQVCGFTLKYDLDGNPIKRIYSDKTITYTYDPLGRLTEITHPHQKVCYSYDPFSRLLAKEVYADSNGTWTKSYFLYDQDKEIGLFDETGTLIQLKVLGLGIRGDIGAAVALEIENTLYAPLHDFRGNLIALISSNGEIAEAYNLDAFGIEARISEPISPWRFASKRHDEGLVFFGLRFYDPTLKRWLTPDPAGFADGANLYAYVLNSPFNRLDLFGLNSEDFLIDLRIEVPINTFYGMTSVVPLYFHGAIQGVPTNFIVACGYFHQLRYTPMEDYTGKINLAEHFAELMPKTGVCIGLCTITKGINTTVDEFEAMCQSDIHKRSEGTLFISPYFPTDGFRKDKSELNKDIARVATYEGDLTRQFMVGIAERLHKVNPSLLWDLCGHSRGELLAIRAIEDMTDDQKELMKDHLCFTGLGGVEPMARKFGYDVDNIYSNKDHAVNGYVKPFLKNPDYDITYLPCRSPIRERSAYLADHAFMGSTYQFAREQRIRDLRGDYGYYKATVR